jgi:hypothetical protein
MECVVYLNARGCPHTIDGERYVGAEMVQVVPVYNGQGVALYEILNHVLQLTLSVFVYSCASNSI